MRGDRPDAPSATRTRVWATPHARGSTYLGRPGRCGQDGYPACAGIDHSYSPRKALSSGLPRMRGDRPPANKCVVYDCTATPHARGSTCAAFAYQQPNKGYPACAGIDLRVSRSLPHCNRLPRMRGDRPADPTRRDEMKAATPHARGSTLSSLALSAWSRGYPACAGIDLVMM